jgi:methylated-DNA-protein-cysteine methyltransferase-like protein
MDKRTEFSKRVVKLIRSIPKGKVATYGLIAKLAGKPQGARGVGWLLHSSAKAHRLPWQRVIKTDGRLSFPESTRAHARQKRLLEKEGVIVANGRVDLKKHLWKKKPPRPKGSRRLPRMFADD